MNSEIPTIAFLNDLADITKGREIKDIIIPLSEIEQYITKVCGEIDPKAIHEHPTSYTDAMVELMEKIGDNHIIYDDVNKKNIGTDSIMGEVIAQYYPIIERVRFGSEGKSIVDEYAFGYKYGEEMMNFCVVFNEEGIMLKGMPDDEDDESIIIEDGKWSYYRDID